MARLQLVLTGIFEDEAGARGEVLHRLRYEDLAGLRLRTDASADHDAESADLAIDSLTLAGVHPGSDLDA